MPIELKFHNESSYLHVHASGDWTTKAAENMITRIREKALKENLTCIYIDCVQLSSPDTEMTRYFTGQAIARDLRYPFKTVAVVREEVINKFAENVATNRGARILVTPDNKSAMEWLNPN